MEKNEIKVKDVKIVGKLSKEDIVALKKTHETDRIFEYIVGGYAFYFKIPPRKTLSTANAWRDNQVKYNEAVLLGSYVAGADINLIKTDDKIFYSLSPQVFDMVEQFEVQMVKH
jgi:hypothetical protein